MGMNASEKEKEELDRKLRVKIEAVERGDR